MWITRVPAARQPRFNGCFMDHFGKLLKALIADRGLTQLQVAERAGVSEATIQRAGPLAVCPWRRTVAVDVLGVLQAAAPLTPDEEAAYLRGAKLAARARHAREVYEQAKALGLLKPFEPGALSPGGPEPEADPDVLTVHIFAEALMAERGAKNLITAMEALAAAWDIDLPPRVRATDVATGTAPRLTIVHPPKRIEDREVTIYEPVTPAPGRPKAQQKRRTGA